MDSEMPNTIPHCAIESDTSPNADESGLTQRIIFTATAIKIVSHSALFENMPFPNADVRSVRILKAWNSSKNEIAINVIVVAT